MEDIDGIPTDEYVGCTYSVDQHDEDGKVTDVGIFLNHGGCSIKVATTFRGFKAYIKHVSEMTKEIEKEFTYRI